MTANPWTPFRSPRNPTYVFSELLDRGRRRRRGGSLFWAGNANNQDWVIMLEAGTIVGPSGGKLRIARSTQKRKVTAPVQLRFC